MAYKEIINVTVGDGVRGSLFLLTKLISVSIMTNDHKRN